MWQINEIKKLSGGRYLVRLDEDISFPMYGKELEEYGIREEAVLQDMEYSRIMQELLPKRAKLCAMHLLEKKEWTEHQLRDKLHTLFYPEEIIDQAVAYVKAYHYIDDLRYAASYIEYRMEKKSIRQLEQELMQKGISREVVREAAEQIELPEEETQIRKWLEKKHYAEKSDDPRERERMYRFLLGKGYSISSVGRVLRSENLYE